MPVQLDELVISAQRETEIVQQAQTNKELSQMNQTLSLILEQLKKLEDAIRSLGTMP